MRFDPKTMMPVLIPTMLATPPAWAADPYEKPDESWLSVSSAVASVSPNSFRLNYGDGIITVEMDDGDRDADGYKLVKGDEVTVTGRIDDDLFEQRTIEASSVYVDSIGAFFYASAVDEEDVGDVLIAVETPVVLSSTIVQGPVTEVDEQGFTVDAGLRRVRVQVDEMSYNPLDDDGYQKIEVGDRVSVSGQMDNDLFDRRVLEASSVVTLSSGKS